LKKLSITVLALALLLSFQATSVFASSSMDAYIDDVKGTKYKYGGTTTSGFDCSGFTSYIFAKMGYDLSRRSSDQATMGKKVEKSELIAGDLVFFDTSGKNNDQITHVGIYVGNGNFAHASTSKGVIINALDTDYYKTRFVTARRVLSEADHTTYVLNNN